VPGETFVYKEQSEFDLHLALEVAPGGIEATLERARQAGVDARGPADHGFVRSIYLRDPSGYVVELVTREPGHDRTTDPRLNHARATLDAWQAGKGAR
jgi:catechol-2,3-dioxygenase